MTVRPRRACCTKLEKASKTYLRHLKVRPLTVDEDTNDYKQAIEALDDYSKVATNLPYEQHLLRDLLQTEDETMDQYVSRLRS